MVVVPGHGIIPAEMMSAKSVELFSTLHDAQEQVATWGVALKLIFGTGLDSNLLICLYALYFVYIR